MADSTQDGSILLGKPGWNGVILFHCQYLECCCLSNVSIPTLPNKCICYPLADIGFPPLIIWLLDLLGRCRQVPFGVSFGAGVMFPVGNNQLFIEGGYHLGLSNLAKPEDSDDDTDVKTSGIQFKVGLLFSLGGE